MFGYHSYKMDHHSNPHGSVITEDSQLDSRTGGTRRDVDDLRYRIIVDEGAMPGRTGAPQQ